MSSFQQVAMGGICLVAAFWFGSYINERPVTLQQSVSELPGGPSAAQNETAQTQNGLAAQTQGFFAALFEAPAKSKPVTLADLKSRSAPDDNRSIGQEAPSPFVMPANQLESPQSVTDSVSGVDADFSSPPAPGDMDDLQRLAIVPDFSTLVQDVRNEQMATPARHKQPAASDTAQVGSLLPVPKMKDFSSAAFEQPARDWNAVRQRVMSVEEKLKQFRQAHPVAETFKPVPALKSTSGRVAAGMPVLSEPVSGIAEVLQPTESQPTVKAETGRRVKGGAANSSLDSDSLPGVVIPENQLRSEIRQLRAENQRLRSESHLTGRANWNPRANRSAEAPQRPDPLYAQDPRATATQPASRTPETLAERQRRWEIFGDRTRTRQPQSSTRPPVPATSAISPSGALPEADVTPVVTTSGPAQKHSSRVRSLNESSALGGETGMRGQQVADGQRVAQNQADSPSNSRQEENWRRTETVSAPTDGSAAAEVVRYGDFESYVTREADTLQTISESFYGTSEYYFDLYLANRGTLVNPATVPVGIKLRIPKIGQ